MEKKEKRIRIIYITIIVILIVTVVGGGCFFWLDTTIKGRNAYREAKNVRLALNMLQIEYYSQGKTIFDPSKADGLADGVKDRIDVYVGHESDVRLLAFNKKTKSVYAMEYYTGKFRVDYTYDKEKQSDEWTVELMLPILHYGVN